MGSNGERPWLSHRLLAYTENPKRLLTSSVRQQVIWKTSFWNPGVSAIQTLICQWPDSIKGSFHVFICVPSFRFSKFLQVITIIFLVSINLFDLYPIFHTNGEPKQLTLFSLFSSNLFSTILWNRFNWDCVLCGNLDSWLQLTTGLAAHRLWDCGGKWLYEYQMFGLKSAKQIKSIDYSKQVTPLPLTSWTKLKRFQSKDVNSKARSQVLIPRILTDLCWASSFSAKGF